MLPFRASMRVFVRRLLGLFNRPQVAANVAASIAVPAALPAVTYEPLIFLDTNNLHWARLYIDFAESKKLPPFSSADMNTADSELEKHFSRSTLDSYIKGRQIVGYLAKQCKDAGAQVEYSPITTLELVCGLLRGSAVLEAAGVGVPHRMWGKMDEHEILGLLAPDKYREIEKRTDDIAAQFQKVGISLKETDPRHLPEVWSLAKLILSWVYLEVGDVVVYMSALLAEADELLTSDGYLWDVANKIQGAGGLMEPDKTHFLKIQEDLRTALSKMIPAPITEVVLAKPRKPNKL